MRIGRRIMISVQSAEAWREAREAETAATGPDPDRAGETSLGLVRSDI